MVEMACEEHDRIAAGSQFITHTIGRVLGAMNPQPSAIDTRGYEARLSHKFLRSASHLATTAVRNRMGSWDQMQSRVVTVGNCCKGYVQLLLVQVPQCPCECSCAVRVSRY